MEFKITIEAARVNRGMSVAEASDALGIHYATLRAYEKGSADIKKSIIEKMCVVYEVPIENLKIDNYKLKDDTFTTVNQPRLNRIYRGMKTRCYNKNNHAFPIYGGKGVKICDEWLESFSAFCKWAINNGYADDLTIDRIDSNGDYCPQNCQWITQSENSKKVYVSPEARKRGQDKFFEWYRKHYKR